MDGELRHRAAPLCSGLCCSSFNPTIDLVIRERHEIADWIVLDFLIYNLKLYSLKRAFKSSFHHSSALLGESLRFVLLKVFRHDLTRLDGMTVHGRTMLRTLRFTDALLFLRFR